jgi:hypothetical protein
MNDELASVDHEVESRRRDVDVSAAHHFAVDGVSCRQISGTREDFRQHAADAIGQVQRDQNGSRKIRGDVLDHALQRPNSAGRGTDRNDVNFAHVIS